MNYEGEMLCYGQYTQVTSILPKQDASPVVTSVNVCVIFVIHFLSASSLVNFSDRGCFDQKRRTFLKELEETQDLQNSLLEKQHAVVAEQKAVHDRSRYLRKQLGLLTKDLIR
jgi:uncharacterized coiled-coil protein SlyX